MNCGVPPCRFIVLCGIIVASGWLIGCQAVSEEEMRRSVLSEDPTFAELLDRKAEIDAAIQTERNRLAEERQDLDRRIEVLKADFDVSKARTDGLVDGLRSRLDPERQQLALELRTTKETLKARHAEFKSLERTITLVERSLDDSPTPAGDSAAGETRPADERQQRLVDAQQRLEVVQRDIERLRHNQTMLDHKRRLLRQR